MKNNSKLTSAAVFFFCLFICGRASAQFPSTFGLFKPKLDSPTFIQKAETAWNNSTSPKTTSSFNVNTGDLLVAYVIAESEAGTFTISGGSLAWTMRKQVDRAGYTEVVIWTATATSTTSLTVTFTNSTGSINFGGNVLTFRNSAGGGSAGSAISASGAPSLNFTTGSNGSAVVVVNGDWSATDGATRTWRLGASEQSYHFGSGVYTAYGALIANIGNAGTYNVGLSLPTGQAYALAALEVRTSGSGDPCGSGGAIGIGTPCSSGTIYAGQFDGGKYMITPSGCTNSSTPTCAGGTDTLQKNWIGTGGSRANIAGVTDVGAEATPSSSSQRGDVTTPLIAAHASIASDSAADYCQDLNYGGFTDWYLGSKSEMAYIYCHSAVSIHLTNKPPEDPDCASYGGKTSDLQGFAFNNYATSTESDADYVWEQSFTNGWQSNNWKDGLKYVRCIRRY